MHVHAKLQASSELNREGKTKQSHVEALCSPLKGNAGFVKG